MRYIFLIFLFSPFLGKAQNTLAVEVLGVKNSEGSINVAVYKDSEGFLKFDHVFTSNSTQAREGVTHLLIDNLPNGEYALAVFHDENGNDELDTNWLGIPKEPVGFSNARMKLFGPPSFKECSVVVPENNEVEVILN